MPSFSITFKAIHELGLKKLGLFTWYQLGLRSGYLRWSTQSALRAVKAHQQYLDFQPVLKLPGQDELIAVLGSDGIACLLTEADEIASGQVRLFGGDPVPLQLSLPGQLLPWTEYERDDSEARKVPGYDQDIKIIWEPGRFGWAYTLARAYYLSGNERYPEAFWKYAMLFLDNNPPYLGPHWASAQEVALRLMAFVFALQVFNGARNTSPDNKARLKESIAEHAARIPPTRSYAHAQNNNHLLSEAAGLITAGFALPNHPAAQNWLSFGWRWLNNGLKSQIAVDGTYTQHSTNYHRLMLQIALWINTLSEKPNKRIEPNPANYGFSRESIQRLSSATLWLLAVLDHQSGCVPNLGPNDGAYILPLTVCSYSDFRPVLQAAACAFLGERPFPAGQWDEMYLWLRDNWQGERGKDNTHYHMSAIPTHKSPHVLHNSSNDSWAYIRAAQFADRPGHADQLHVDLWWRGLNIAQDAGTYSYNAQPPWDNALTHTSVHNTLTINECDQMTSASKFLYLDWAQAHLVSHEQAEDGAWERISAQHNGYHRIGVTHRRSLTAQKTGEWIVEDILLNKNLRIAGHHSPFSICLHWLLPDWSWEFVRKNRDSEIGTQTENLTPQLTDKDLPLMMLLQSPQGWITLQVDCTHNVVATTTTQQDTPDPHPLQLQVIRAGKLLLGDGGVSPILGWFSPTYGVKKPALSLRINVKSTLPVSFTSTWRLPENSV